MINYRQRSRTAGLLLHGANITYCCRSSVLAGHGQTNSCDLFQPYWLR